MIRLLLAAGRKRAGGKVLLDLPLLTDTLDASGNTVATRSGYSSPTDGIVTIDGRGALRVTQNKGVNYVVKAGGIDLFKQRKWTLEFEIKFASVTAFRHDAFFASWKEAAGTNFTLALWNNQYQGNRLIISTPAKPTESQPFLIEGSGVSNNVWYKYRLEWSSVDKMMKLYKDDVLSASALCNEDLVSKRFDIRALPSDYFDGWLRNIKITGED